MTHEFHSANLRGADFRGKNLTEADFSYADIRGADFRNAVLVGANFSNARAGLRTFRTISLVALSLILSLLAGLMAGYAGALIGHLLNVQTYGASFFGGLCLVALAIFLIVIIRQGLGVTLATLAEIVAACLILALAFFPNNQEGLLKGTIFTTQALAGAMASVGNMAVAITLGRAMALPKPRALVGFLAFIGAVVGVLLGVTEEEAFPVAGLVSLAAIALGIYVGWQAMVPNPKYRLIRRLAVGIVTQGGTSFRNANLTDADFTQATLKSVDFRQATLTRTCWFQANKLAQARVEGTYLANSQIRELVVTKDGRNKNFDSLNLRCLNLKNAKLQKASFIHTDLSEATLQNANLLKAKLAQAQLYQAILTEACLTGAYIQDLGISTDTQLDDIKCEYVYMQLPTEDEPYPYRKPDNLNETFKEGDFTDFIAPLIKTLNLYQTQNVDMRQIGSKFKTLDLFHHQGIDPTAAAMAVIQLAEKYPDAEFEIVALEGRGKEKIRLQAKVAGEANRSQLSIEYFQKYTEIESLNYNDLQSMLIEIAEKEKQINSLEKLLQDAIQSPKFYVETQQTQGDIIMSQDNKGNISVSGTQGNVSGIAGAGENLSMTGAAIGAISGNVTNTINQLPDSPESDKPGIKELLAQLQAAIEAETSLDEEEKAEALEQVKTLAEAGANPSDKGMKKLAKNATRMLKGIIADLPTAAKLVEICKDLLPAIANLFNL
ncbi:MAG: low-complexity protein [Moorea sp. SIO2B7]|nr:low-complexity protein [Moorena sp. SIO2B7]